VVATISGLLIIAACGADPNPAGPTPNASAPSANAAAPPLGGASASGEHIVLDMAIWVLPPGDEGHCIALEAGRLDITAQLIGSAPMRPIRFVFAGYSPSDTATPVDTMLTAAPTTFTSQVGGGLYCYELSNRTPAAPTTDRAALTALGQYVALFMVQTLP
jgi:hypothetical protein